MTQPSPHDGDRDKPTITSPDDDDDPSYIDYETFLSPSFHAPTFANTLVLATNNPSDTPLDLSTPLSRVLFDAQEVDAHIDRLSTRHALPLLQHTQDQAAAGERIVKALEAQLKAVNESYAQLEREVSGRYDEAAEVRRVAARVWEAARLGRAVSRVLQLGRTLEVQFSEVGGGGVAGKNKEDHRALGRCVYTLLSLRDMFDGHSAEGEGLERVVVVRQLREGVVKPIETAVRDAAERIVREFSVGGTGSAASTYAQSEEARARTASAVTALYLLSPVDATASVSARWTPTLMLQALETYLRSALQSSIAGLSRALSSLPSLDKTLTEVSARCQNVVALEAVLDGIRAPQHPLLSPTRQPAAGTTMLQPLLAHLETGSLASYFWRTMASSMAPRVQDIVARGGTAARTLRANRQAVGEAIRECVARGSQLPSAVAAAAAKGKGKEAEQGRKSWEREVAVMVGSVVNNLGR
ncbi:hypothetical protein VTJ49DRAFT_3952 [Mycothermus thermophilus]|uniref:Conserved oligomeric Golgi complex subunit 5 n=1 Tax=Humicola insolens TaxID=85995 RepID=A0ABR3V6X1_HUMIN